MGKRVVAVVALVAAVLLVNGCGLSGDPQHVIARAQALRHKTECKSGIIQMKNLLQRDASYAEARYLLELIYYDAYEFRLAEAELRGALELRYDRDKALPALGKALVMPGDYQKVIDQIPVDGQASDSVQAEVLSLRARVSGAGADELCAPVNRRGACQTT